MRKRGDAGEIITANFLDFPPNFRLTTRFQAILGDFRPFLSQIFCQFFLPKKPSPPHNSFFSCMPKAVKKTAQRVQNSQNKDQMASDLLWESINSVHQPTVGIHQFCPRSYCGNPLFTNSATNLLWESINSVLRPTVGIHQFCPPSYCGNPLEYIQQLSAFRFYWARSPK